MIWTDVVQSIVLVIGAAVVLGLMMSGMPEGPAQTFAIASEHDKFSLGSFGPELTVSTFWVVLLYGIFINLTNFGIDQSFVQRYHAARDERQAARSVWLGALLYVPISLGFFMIGSAAFSYYRAQPEMMHDVRSEVAKQKTVELGRPVTAAELTDEDISDKVLPHFIAYKLPPGLAGLLIAAIFAAAMSSIDTSLNSPATVILSDLYKRYVNPRQAPFRARRPPGAGSLKGGPIRSRRPSPFHLPTPQRPSPYRLLGKCPFPSSSKPKTAWCTSAEETLVSGSELQARVGR